MSRVVTLRMKHWLEVDGRFAIGDGGVELLARDLHPWDAGKAA